MHNTKIVYMIIDIYEDNIFNICNIDKPELDKMIKKSIIIC